MKPRANLFQKVCDEMISLDDSIRFAGISDKEGKLLAVSQRQNLKPLLSDEERAQYAITASYETVLGYVGNIISDESTTRVPDTNVWQEQQFLSRM